MSAFDNFINSLSNAELAIFIRYRYPGFLESSRQKIDSEVKKRKLSSEYLEILSNKKIDAEIESEINHCPRCGSTRLFVETDFVEKPISEVSSVEIGIESLRCRLCGYNPDKNTPKTLTEKVKIFFWRGQNRRIVKWNEVKL